MTKTADTGLQLEVVYAPPYTGGILTGPGQWFEGPDGYVWTNNRDTLNLLDFNNPTAAHVFNSVKREMFDRGLNAAAAFSALVEDGNVSISSGNLTVLDALYNERMHAMNPITAAGEPVDDAEYGITLDDEGSVLELVKIDSNGVYVRSEGHWVALDPNAPETDEDTVYGREWVDTGADAVNVYDSLEDQDIITKDNFLTNSLDVSSPK